MKHVHKYKKQKIGRRKDYVIYRCILPACTHYVAEDFIEGRTSLCWRCNNEFVIIRKLLKLKPICDDCRKLVKKGIKPEPIEGFDLDKVLSDMGQGDEEDFL